MYLEKQIDVLMPRLLWEKHKVEDFLRFDAPPVANFSSGAFDHLEDVSLSLRTSLITQKRKKLQVA